MRKNILSSFIESISDIVDDPTTDHIISWSLNGTSFFIHDQQAFADVILSKNFKHRNLSSFIRQLNMYSFHKAKSRSDKPEFYHKLFRRGAKQLLVGIKRKPSSADQKQAQVLLSRYLHKNSSSGSGSPLPLPKCQDPVQDQIGYEINTADSLQKRCSLITNWCDHVEPVAAIPMGRVVENIIIVYRPNDMPA